MTIWLIALLTGCNTPSIPQEEFIWVKDQNLNSIVGTWREYKLVLDGGTYQAENDPWGSQDPFGEDPMPAVIPVISVTELETLRQALQDAPRSSEDLLEALRITPETIASRQEAIYLEVLPAHWKQAAGDPPTMPPEIERKFEFETLSPILLDYFTGELGSTTSTVSFQILLPGDPQMKVQARGFHPGLLPFQVTAGDTSWEVYDPTLIPLIRKLFSRRSVSDQTLQAVEEWRRGWVPEDMMIFFFNGYIGYPADRVLSREFCENLAGAERGKTLFEVGEAHSGDFSSYGFSVSIDLKPKQSKWIRQIRWYIPLGQPPPEEGWMYIENALKTSEGILNKHRVWDEWLAASSSNAISLLAVGPNRKEGEWEEFEREILPAWKQAGFKGEPECKITFYVSGPASDLHKEGAVRSIGEGVLGLEEDRILIVSWTKGHPPFNGVKDFDLSDFHPSFFGIAHPDGSLEMKSFERPPPKEKKDLQFNW